MIEAGLLEIYRFLPPPLLEHFDLEAMDLEEFLSFVARARYIEELEKNIVARAVSELFAEE